MSWTNSPIPVDADLDAFLKCEVPRCQVALKAMIKDHQKQVARQDREQWWLMARQWNDIKTQATHIAVLREMLAALRTS